MQLKGGNDMQLVSMFLKEFEKHMQRTLTIDDVSYETIWLYKDEIDETLIPADVLETLSEVVVASSILFVDENEVEYMRIAVQDEKTLAYDKYVRWFVDYKAIDW